MIAAADRGSISILSCSLLAAGVSLSIHVFDFGRHLADGARVQSTADAVALAGVVGSREFAERVARENGASIVSFVETFPLDAPGSTVVVIVRAGERVARASASDAP